MRDVILYDTYFLSTLLTVHLSHSHETSLSFCSHHEVIRWTGCILHLHRDKLSSFRSYLQIDRILLQPMFTFTIEYSSVSVKDKLASSEPKEQPGRFHYDHRSSPKFFGRYFPRVSSALGHAHFYRLQCTRDIHQW